MSKEPKLNKMSHKSAKIREINSVLYESEIKKKMVKYF